MNRPQHERCYVGRCPHCDGIVASLDKDADWDGIQKFVAQMMRERIHVSRAAVRWQQDPRVWRLCDCGFAEKRAAGIGHDHQGVLSL